MTGMSLLRPSLGQCLRLVVANGKATQTLLHKQTSVAGQICVRNAGHERRMVIIPSKFEWTRFKNDLHFYFLLGLIPMFAAITYVNISIGPAELAEIPEDYEPEEWEYFQSPIKRWFSKYMYTSPPKEYEKTLHFLHNAREQRYWNMIDRKVKMLMSDRQDYKGWYWVNKEKTVVEANLEAKEEASRRTGTS